MGQKLKKKCSKKLNWPKANIFEQFLTFWTSMQVFLNDPKFELFEPFLYIWPDVRRRAELRPEGNPLIDVLSPFSSAIASSMMMERRFE